MRPILMYFRILRMNFRGAQLRKKNIVTTNIDFIRERSEIDQNFIDRNQMLYYYHVMLVKLYDLSSLAMYTNDFSPIAS